MLSAPHDLDTALLTQSRDDKKVCEEPNCGRHIKRGELYLRFSSGQRRRERLRCVLCEAKHQIMDYRSRADALAKFVEKHR